MTLEQIRALPTMNSGDYCDKNGVKLESLYGSALHSRGATLPDIINAAGKYNQFLLICSSY